MKTIVLNEQEFRDVLRNESENLLNELIARLKDTFASDKKLDAKQAAQFLGISLSTLYKSVKELPHKKFGKKLIFSAQELRDLPATRKAY
jgi:predicted DNA-binding transcriptional regulator AlpA